MIKKKILTFFVLLTLSVNSYSAGSSDKSSDNSKTKTNYDKAVAHIKLAKKYEKKDKIILLVGKIKRSKGYDIFCSSHTL